MAKERFELSDGVKDLLSGMGKLSAEMKDNSAKAMEYAQSMDKLAKQNTELTKLNEALSTSFSKVSNALNKASSGNDLTKYIKSQEDMVKSINRTYKQYSIQSDTIKKNQLAEELYKQVNALRAVTDSVDLSNLIGNFEEVKKAISSVGSYVKSEFSVSAFKEINETIEVLEQAGLKIKNVFSTLDKGSQFYDIDRELRETKKQLDLINNTDISELTGKLKKLGEIAEDEFNTFLNLYNLSGSSYKFYDIFEEIRSGAITSQQAIERVKNEFDYLLVEAKSSGNQHYDILNSSAIREMVENISTLRIKVDEIMTKISNTSGEKTRMEIFDEEQFNRLLILFERIESSLSSMKAVFVDVGDGEEFSPLLKMIDNVQSSIKELSTSVKGIGLNMNIDVGSDSEAEAKVQSKISNALQAYQRLFDHIKMSSAGGSIINTKFFDFDINQYDTMMGKLQAYKKFIDNMRKEAKTQFNGQDVLYQDTDKSYWTAVSSAMGQVTKAFNEMNASAGANPLENLFGKTDLTEVVTQLNLIVDKLGEISTTASEFKNVFANGFNVSASVEEIEKLTSRVKELEDELSKVKVSSTAPVETNISSPIKDTFQEDTKVSAESSSSAVKEEAKAMEQVAENAEKASKGKDKFAKANKKVKESADSSSKAVSEEASEFNKVISKLDGYNTKLANFTVKPADGNRYPIYQKNIDDLTEKINKLQVLSEKDINLINTNDVDDAKKLQKEIDELIFKMSKMSASEKGFDPLGADKALEKINSELKKNSAMSKEAKRQIQGFYDEIRSGNPSKPIKDLLDDMYKLIQAERLAGREGKSFMDIFKEKVVYGAAANIAGMIGIYDIINVGREGVTVIRELDTALTEMRKVSDETVSSLERFQDVSFDLADDVGTTAKQIQNSTADWMRLGEAMSEASESAQVSNILLNVSEFESIDEATSSLVSMSQAYKDLEKIEIVDTLNKLGNEYAISTDGLAIALKDSASALKTAQNDFYEASALTTAANTVVQDPSKVGAGLRTISLRLTGTEAARKELEELGEDVSDFQVTTTSKLNQQIMDLTRTQDGLSVSLLDMNGNYRSTYEILLDIAKVWDKIAEEDLVTGENRQNALLEMMAGKNRSNILASILESPEVLESAYNSAINATGSAQEELDKFLESIDGRMAKLENQAQEFWYKLIDSDTIKNGITLLTELLGLATDFVDTFGALGTAGAGIGAYLGIKNAGKTYKRMVSNRYNCFEYALHA